MKTQTHFKYRKNTKTSYVLLQIANAIYIYILIFISLK